jgi:hypothetical protein
MPGGFSGNGSVEWFVVADNAIEPPVSRKEATEEKPNRWRQSGVDHWGNISYDFTITIKIPKDSFRPNAKRDFANALEAALRKVNAAPPDSDEAVTITLPVEDKDHSGPTKEPTRDQILIDWQPATTLV